MDTQTVVGVALGVIGLVVAAKVVKVVLKVAFLALALYGAYLFVSGGLV